MEEHLTVGRLAGLAGVTVRTLHHYDEIGLVRPSARTVAGYRVYSAGDVERLREVLACRRLGFGLREVADLVSDPSADAAAHLGRLHGGDDGALGRHAGPARPGVTDQEPEYLSLEDVLGLAAALAAKAAALMHSLARNHALIDGNKRLALLATVVFLRISGYRLALTDDEPFDPTLAVAAGQLEAEDIEQRLRLEPAGG
jgi:DNA-binding transcriptional MerR regulator